MIIGTMLIISMVSKKDFTGDFYFGCGIGFLLEMILETSTLIQLVRLLAQ